MRRQPLGGATGRRQRRARMTTPAMDASGPGAVRSARDVVRSPEFRALASRRALVSVSLTAVLFATYYGYVVLIAADGRVLARTIGGVTTLAIPVGIGVIVVAWVLTAIYVGWANRAYEPRVEKLKKRLE